jgi:hypothetical protein
VGWETSQRPSLEPAEDGPVEMVFGSVLWSIRKWVIYLRKLAFPFHAQTISLRIHVLW